MKKVHKKSNNKFSIKCKDPLSLKAIFKKMKIKKSSGCDGLSQAHLAAGAPALTESLVKIYNKSISEGKFPTAWKEAVVTPVHKKGDKSQIDNYKSVFRLRNLNKLLLSPCERSK